MVKLLIPIPEHAKAFAGIIAAAGTPQASAIVGQLVTAAATPRALALLGIRVLDAAHLLKLGAAAAMLRAAGEGALAEQIRRLEADLLLAAD